MAESLKSYKSPKMIDLNRLLHFCDGDRALAAQVFAMMKPEIDTAVARLDELLANQQWEMLSNTAHKLKSHCEYLGASSLAELARQVESQADAGIGTDLPSLIHNIKALATTLPETL